MIFGATILGRGALGLVAAGWLAQALASTNRDVDAGIAAYEAGDHEAALTAYEAAVALLGERPELHYNRGLALLGKGDVEAARRAFEHGTESEFLKNVRASAEYELGNLDFDAKAWDAAIERYTSCLKLDPEHAGAKWNLELALLRKAQEEEEKKKEEEEKEKKEDEKKEDEKKEDEKKEDEEKEDEKKEDEKKEKEEKEDEKKEDEKKEDEKKEDEEKEDEKKEDEPKRDEKKEPQQEPQQEQPQPLERADLEKALEQLDAEDDFVLGRPLGRQGPVEKDW